MDEATLRRRLERFGGDEAERRAVARAARDLADDGRFAADEGYPLTAAVVVDELADRREGGPAVRWNWWLGALEIAHGAADRTDGDSPATPGTSPGGAPRGDPSGGAEPDAAASDRYLPFRVRRWGK